MSNHIQKYIDRFWAVTLIRLLPKNVSADFFTWLRLILIAPIIAALIDQKFILAIIIFAVAALCDSLDGAIARTQKRSTRLGLILDPLIDKLLIIFLAVYLFFAYPYQLILVILIVIESTIIVSALLFSLITHQKNALPANIIGKAKMLLEAAAIILALCHVATGNGFILSLSFSLFCLATVAATISALNYLVVIIKKPSA